MEQRDLPRPPGASLPSVPERLEQVLRECTPLEVGSVALTQAAGLCLAEEIVSGVDSPPFDKSMMDGYAIRYDDGMASGLRLRIVGELPAGGTFSREVHPGEAVRIMTGAPIPAGADAVVRLEETILLDDQTIEVRSGSVRRGTNILRRGQMLRAGEVVLTSGRRLRPQELALLAELGRATVRVYRRPRLAVLATGDELVPPGQPLGEGQICNSNESLLMAQGLDWGCEVAGLGIARDRESELREKIEQGLTSDVLILTGGVSMGARDLVPKVLAHVGVRQVFHKVHLKPGKPMWFGVREDGASATARGAAASAARSGRCLIFALPGNPVSSMVCSELFVAPAVRALQGDPHPCRCPIPAQLTRDHVLREDRPTYFPARLSVAEGIVQVTPTAWQGSADLRSTIDANGMIAFPAGERTYRVGERVEVIPWSTSGWAAER